MYDFIIDHFNGILNTILVVLIIFVGWLILDTDWNLAIRETKLFLQWIGGLI